MSAPTREDPGRLRHRIVLEQPTRAPDGCGGSTLSYVPVAMVWAAIDAKAVLRPLVADQLDERQRHAILIRHRDDVASGWQVLFGDRTLAVEHVRDPDERGDWLELLTLEQGR